MITKPLTFARRVMNNRRSVLSDAKLVAQNAWSIPLLALPWNKEPGVLAELNPESYNNIGDVINVASQAVIPWHRNSCSLGTISLEPDNFSRSHSNEKWFFINGILTSPPVAILNGKELANAFERTIHLIHTPTYGLAWDLWDCFTARTLRKDGHLSRPAYKTVKAALLNHQRVVIIAHSQGTIVASYIARKLLKDKQHRHLAKNLEIYCIAGVADSQRVDHIMSHKEKRGVPYVEHFVNGLDFFGRIGILSHEKHSSGPIYNISNKAGHLLNDHYIPAIKRGEYCQGASRLHRYINGGDPDNHYTHYVD